MSMSMAIFIMVRSPCVWNDSRFWISIILRWYNVCLVTWAGDKILRLLLLNDYTWNKQENTTLAYGIPHELTKYTIFCYIKGIHAFFIRMVSFRFNMNILQFKAKIILIYSSHIPFRFKDLRMQTGVKIPLRCSCLGNLIQHNSTFYINDRMQVYMT